ncbi:peptidase, M23/M37 family protein [Pseudooceanicola batsensis HTCC2597]|uniref:Peptidase, M23/M37 family protein n=1 Tax=Pseudooceanicola batsensis (strain ATCC BAA-863 / DSM 15984 / KCTC 12145 / HTCC2597) TaxID=252305 RepID=A3U2S5_PSEBH|nr:peptidase, M23/M37 family protein [Pseudooceanicola batsensis HTCC2597]
MERHFPERRLFLRSDSDTRFIRLKPLTQLIAFSGSAAVIAWTIIATAVLLMDTIGSGNFREQAKRDQRIYQERLNAMADERDMRAEEAVAAQERFNSALEQISVMQSQLLAAETRLREAETGLGVVQSTLRRTMKERDEARAETEVLEARLGQTDTPLPGSAEAETNKLTLEFMTDALAQTAAERDQITADAQDALDQADELSHQIAMLHDQNDRIFRQLEEAMTVSIKPLDKMFRSAGMNTDRIIDQVRRGYSGQGGPLTPISLSTKGELPSLDASRANRIINQLDRLNLYRIAAEKAPFAVPVKSSYRFTSGFGYRRDPKNGGRRMHSGVDFAGPVGTPLYSAGDGVVTHAGWQSGYGRIVKIQHQFGIETRYAHMSRIRVKVGQRVSRGDRIGDMGASGRVTGPHLHYEVRVGGKAVNPMIYIKAANDVF